MNPDAQRLAGALQSEPGPLMVRTGAGVSAASGLATFRGTDPNAIWNVDVKMLASGEHFRRNPVESWMWFRRHFARVPSALPNAKLCPPPMLELLKALVRQPWWMIVLILGAALVVLPTVSIRTDKGYDFSTHPPTTFVPVGVGGVFVAISIVGVWLMYRRASLPGAGTGLDLSRVAEQDGALCTVTSGCEIRVVNGRIEQYAHQAGVVALPCNEYFDDRCVDDTSSALGAYANTTFQGQTPAFVSLMREEAARRFEPGVQQRKTRDEIGISFGTGRCLLLQKPLGRSTHVAMISTTTQRAEEGLSSRISYLFEGMRSLVAQLADARLSEVVMPLMGSGHGHIEKPLALVGLLLAIAEVAHYGQGSQRLRRVTVVVFQRDEKSQPEVDRVVVQRALALIGSHRGEGQIPAANATV